MKPYVVPREWEGAAVAIVAAGPSINHFDFDCIAGLKTIAVKDGYLKVPHAEVLMIGDHRYAHRNPDLSAYLGPLILYTDPKPLPDALFDPRIRFIPKVAGGGLSSKPEQLQGTFTTTALAINLAVLQGAKRIFLVGVDGKAGPNGERHFSNDTKEHWYRRYDRQKWGLSRLPRDLKKLGVKVYNLNIDTAIKEFKVLHPSRVKELLNG